MRSTDTVYVTASADRQGLFAPLIVGLLEEIRYATYRRHGAEGRREEPRRAHVAFVLDEVANTAPLPLTAITSEAGGQGLHAEASTRPTRSSSNHGPELCGGGGAMSLPPRCRGIPLVTWRWSELAGREERAGTRCRRPLGRRRLTLTAPPDPARPPPPETTADLSPVRPNPGAVDLEEIQRRLPAVLGQIIWQSHADHHRGIVQATITIVDARAHAAVERAAVVLAFAAPWAGSPRAPAVQPASEAPPLPRGIGSAGGPMISGHWRPPPRPAHVSLPLGPRSGVPAPACPSNDKDVFGRRAPSWLTEEQPNEKSR